MSRTRLSSTLLAAATVLGALACASALTCDITDHGASVTATPAANGNAVQAAFTACADGGTVQVPSGMFVMSGVEVEHLTDVTLNFAESGFLSAPSQNAGQGNPIIEVKHATNLAITCNGVCGFHGNGETWWGTPQANNAPSTIEIKDTTGLTIKGVTFTNPAGTAVALKQVNTAHVSNIIIVATTSIASPFTSGIVMKDGVTDVVVDSASINGVQGYCVQLRGGLGATCASGVTVNGTKCEGAGFAVGPIQDYGVGACISDVNINNCVVSDADTGLLIATAPTIGSPTGSFISNVQVASTYLGATLPVNITEDAYVYFGPSPQPTFPLKITDVSISKVTGIASGPNSVNVKCTTTDPCNIVMTNSQIMGKSGSATAVCQSATIVGAGNNPPIAGSCQ